MSAHIATVSVFSPSNETDAMELVNRILSPIRLKVVRHEPFHAAYDSERISVDLDATNKKPFSFRLIIDIDGDPARLGGEFFSAIRDNSVSHAGWVYNFSEYLLRAIHEAGGNGEAHDYLAKGNVRGEE